MTFYAISGTTMLVYGFTAADGSFLLGVGAILAAVLTFVGGVYAVRKTKTTQQNVDVNTGRIDKAEAGVREVVVQSANAEGKADALTAVVNTLTAILAEQAKQNAANSVRIDRCESERDHLREEVGDLRRLVHAGVWTAAARGATPLPPAPLVDPP